MTITAAYAPNIDQGNGVTVTFAVNFPFGSASDLVITLFDTVANADVVPAPVLNGTATYDYTVGGAPNSDTGIYPNGSVTFNNAPIGNYLVVRERDTPKLQNTQLTNNGPFPAKTIEGTHDRAEMQLQEEASQLSRAIIAPSSDGPVSMVIPPINLRKGSLAWWDPSTGALAAATTTVAQLQSIVEAAEEAAAVAGSDLWSRPVLGEATVPPVAPAFGDRWLVGQGGSGVWTGFDNQVAEWRGAQGWIFSGNPVEGQLLGVPSQSDALWYDTTNGWVSVGGVVHIGMFGVPANKATFDAAAGFTAAIAFCLANNLRQLKAPHNYYFGSSVPINNFGQAFRMEIGGVFAHANLPNYTHWYQDATPIFVISQSPTAGNMVGLDLRVEYFNGEAKATLFSIQNNGCGCSKFYVGRADNFVMVIDDLGGTTQHGSNLYTGGSWQGGMLGARFQGLTDPVESAIVDVNFIWNNQFGGVWLGNGAQYATFTSVSGMDFNGQWVSQMSVASRAGFKRGDSISCVATGATGYVMAVIDWQGSHYLVVAETKNVSSHNSNFSNTNVITNGTASTTVNAPVLTSNDTFEGAPGNNYFDIICGYDPDTTPFTKLKIDCNYLGGIVSGFLHTDDGAWGNSSAANTNTRKGLMITPGPNGQLTFYNRYVSDVTPLLDTTETIMRPYRDLYLAGHGISSASVGGILLTNATPETVFTPPVPAANIAFYLLNIGIPGDHSLRGLALVTIDTAAGVAVDTLTATNVAFSLSGGNVQVTQNTGGPKTVTANYLQINLN